MSLFIGSKPMLDLLIGLIVLNIGIITMMNLWNWLEVNFVMKLNYSAINLGKLIENCIFSEKKSKVVTHGIYRFC